MAFANFDDIATGVLPAQACIKVTGTMEAAGVYHSLWYTAGRPGAAAAPAAGMAGEALSGVSVQGQIPFVNLTGGNTEQILYRLAVTSGVGGSFFLVDRIWQNSGIVVTTTTAQTVNSVTFGARDLNGSSNGEGVFVGLEVRTATTNAGAITNMSMSYTNQAGTAGRTATVISFPATAAAGTFVPFVLAAGDTGVRSIQSITLGTSLVTGAVHLVAFVPKVEVGVPVANVTGSIDAATGGMVKWLDASVPWGIWLPIATTSSNVVFTAIWSQG